MRLEPARPADALAMARIMDAWTRATPWMPQDNTLIEHLDHAQMMIARFEVTVARSWRGMRGFIARDGATVHALYLAPRAKGRGLGRRLLDHAKAREGRLELWCHAANDRARRFYRREGFAEVESTDGAGNDENLPDVRCVWPAPEAMR